MSDPFDLFPRLLRSQTRTKTEFSIPEQSDRLLLLLGFETKYSAECFLGQFYL